MICGAPLILRATTGKSNLIARAGLSFATGYTILSITGLASNMVGVEPAVIQTISTLLCLTWLYMELGKRHITPKNAGILIKQKLERSDVAALGIAGVYTLLLLLMFDRICLWAAGDSVGHASIIRMLLDGGQVPVSIYPLGTNWEYYPKAFHVYSYLWAMLLQIDMMSLIQIVPIAIASMTPLLIYGLVRETDGSQSEIALYAEIAVSILFIQHTAYLIWAGYPALTGEMLMAAAIMGMAMKRSNVNRYVLPMLAVGIIITHPRFMVYLAGVLFIWITVEKSLLNRKYLLYSTLIAAAGIAAVIGFDIIGAAPHTPYLLSQIFSDTESASGYMLRWYPAVLAIPGIIIAVLHRNKLDRLSVSWMAAILAMFILCDTGVYHFGTGADRILNQLYLPLGILAGYTAHAAYVQLTHLNIDRNKAAASLAIPLMIMGVLSTTAVLLSYDESWALPDSDYSAMMWLKEQNFDNAVVINLDSTGGWIYPLTGLKVSNPASVPGQDAWRSSNTISMVKDPTSPPVLKSLSDILQAYDNTLIYASNKTMSNPPRPPFKRFYGAYPNVDVRLFDEEYYVKVYSEDDVWIYGLSEELRSGSSKTG